ncbi:unnamed protein product, partial [Effrenium voratum]
RSWRRRPGGRMSKLGACWTARLPPAPRRRGESWRTPRVRSSKATRGSLGQRSRRRFNQPGEGRLRLQLRLPRGPSDEWVRRTWPPGWRRSAARWM